MDGIENAGLRNSRIPHPRSVAPPSLQEMSESQHNTRSQSSMMRIPAPTGIKRPGADIQSQPETKRQTLAERAAEYSGKRSVSGASTSAAGLTSGLKPTSIVSLATKQQSSKVTKPASTLGSPTHATNATTRSVTSNSRFAQSVTSGTAGPHSSKQSRGAARCKPAAFRPRAATAMGRYGLDDSEEDPPTGPKQQQNGTVTTPSYSTTRTHSGHQPHGKAIVQGRQSLDAAPNQPKQDSVVGSLATSFAALHMSSLKAGRKSGNRWSQPICSPEFRRSCYRNQASANKSPASPRSKGIKPHDTLDTGQSCDDSTCSSATGASSKQDSSAYLALSPVQCGFSAKIDTRTPQKTCQLVAVEIARMESTLSAAKISSPGKAKPLFMTKESNAHGFIVLDVDERLRGVESQFSTMKCVFDQSLAERSSLEELVEISKARANDLQRQRDQLEEKYASAETELEALRSEVQCAALNAERERRQHAYKTEDLARQHLRELDDLRRQFQDDQDKIQRDHREALNAMERHYKAEQEEERKRSSQEIRELNAKLGEEQQGLDLELQKKDKELQQARTAISEAQSELDYERSLKMALQKRMSEATSLNVELEERVCMLQAQVDFFKSDSKQQSDQFASMEARMQDALKIAEEARQKLIKEEMERRILFNKYQELKGNIRVMCRVRPAMEGVESDEARFGFPDAKTSSTQIDVMGPEEKSSLGVITRKTMPFEFDRVFAPAVQNAEIFDEISQLVQSALDGYNVCIFCYGQTGSGKTYTMSSADGMIPRATHMIYDSIKRLEEKSWSYTMEGSFVEVYNEELNDLLGGVSGSPGVANDQDSKKKLEIRHDDVRKTTTVVGCKSVQLDSEEEVEAMLRLAQSNRSVAATKANERSSRSHSIFILKLAGHNTATGERCEGTLNLVDLAGSERLKHSGAEGDRKKETQNINKSLACLGDVIEALGRGAPHIPYRNSKLTHLLQYSLGGNSKTLMFVMVSPLEMHLKETLTSLRFATKVHNTHIGTAKSTKKIEKP